MKTLLASLVLVAACGGGGNNNDMPGDDTPGVDAAIDAPVASMITISGVATTRGLGASTMEAGVLVAAYKNSDEATPIAMATTDAQGMYSMTITTTAGQPLDGFLKATKTGLTVTYLYPPAPISADIMAPLNMVTTSSFGLIKQLCGGLPDGGPGIIALIVVNGGTAQSMPVGGATITTSPAAEKNCYNSAQGFPASQATATATDGVAYGVNVAPGAVTVNAAKTGSTFKSHGVKAFADSLTTTIVTP